MEIDVGHDILMPSDKGCAVQIWEHLLHKWRCACSLSLVRSQERLKLYHSIESTSKNYFPFSTRNDKVPGHKIKVNLYQAFYKVSKGDVGIYALTLAECETCNIATCTCGGHKVTYFCSWQTSIS